MARPTFHNHTTFCDGKHSAEEMVRAAVALGMPAIGFSGHSCTPFVPLPYSMTPEGERAYRAEIARLKPLYADRIRILCGIEQDYWSPAADASYDYCIGSSHYVLKNGHYLPVDDSAETLMAGVNGQYGGDILAFCEDYYRQMADVQRKTQCTFIGHFDLVTKFSEVADLFSQDEPRYVRAALGALDALCADGAVIEINTGAMARGYRTTPYPARFLLERIRQHGNRVILSADCHDAALLQFGLEDAERLAREIGLDILPTL